MLLRAVLRIRAVRPDRRRCATFRWPGVGPTRAAVRAGRRRALTRAAVRAGSASRIRPRRGSQPSRRPPSVWQVWGADSDTSWRRRGRRSRTAPLSPPPSCAGRWSGRPGAAASRLGAISHCVLLRPSVGRAETPFLRPGEPLPQPVSAAPRQGASSHPHRPGAVLPRAVVRIRAVRSDRRGRAIFRWPGAGPTRAAVRPGGAPRLRPPRRHDCHLRRRAPAAGAAGPALLLLARGRSCTGSVPCSCKPSSASGLCALTAGGVPSSAGPAPGLRGPPSGPGGAPRIRPPRRRDCHPRRRAPAAGVAGPALLLHARGRSRTPTGSAPCSCGLSSASGLSALIVGGAPSSAGPAPGLRGPPSGPGDAP